MCKKISILTVCLIIIITMFSGCGILQKFGRKTESDELSPVSSIILSEEQASRLNDKVPVRLYFADRENQKLRIEIRYIPVDEARKSVNNLATVIVNELIKGPVQKNILNATIPEGTKLNTPVKIEAGIATVDLSKDFVENHSGEKTAEQLTIFSIVNSLTELKEIQKVMFTIDGNVQKDFKGNFQFDLPFPRSPSLISREAPVSNVLNADDSVQTGTNISNTDPDKDALGEGMMVEDENVVHITDTEQGVIPPYLDSLQ